MPGAKNHRAEIGKIVQIMIIPFVDQTHNGG